MPEQKAYIRNVITQHSLSSNMYRQGETYNYEKTMKTATLTLLTAIIALNVASCGASNNTPEESINGQKAENGSEFTVLDNENREKTIYFPGREKL